MENDSDNALQPMRIMQLRPFLLSTPGNTVFHFDQAQAIAVEDEDRISSIQYHMQQSFHGVAEQHQVSE